MKDKALLAACMMLMSGVSHAADSLDDVEHIVVFMQENRAFDHYYGAMKGVRGFNDRSAPIMENGKSPFFQPYPGKEYLLPFHVSLKNTSATCMGAPTMSYNADIGMWNGGKMNAWNTARSPGFGMAHFNRDDLPFYYALGDSFLIGDMYYQSTFTATNPNRFHLFSGSNGLSVNSSYNILDDSEPASGVNWTTMAEVLEDKGISWKVYQQKDNFDDNSFAWFDQFKAAKPGSPLYDKGMARSDDLVEDFKSDILNKTLPSVSWIVGPSYLSEHATHHPEDGEDLSARLIKLFSLPEAQDVYKKTIFILNYDEGGQFYDHLWTPTVPTSDKDGKSTVSTVGEITQEERFGIPAGNPIGPGFRVPLFIVSPWTRKAGGVVYSEVSDHTSVLKLIETRFNVSIPNISPWRRAVMSDLTHAFDFANPDYSFPSFPDTSNNTNASKAECDSNPPPKLPKVQTVPTQEAGTKTSRTLPYYFNVSDSVSGSSVTLTMKNLGDPTSSFSPAAVFHVYDYLSLSKPPKKYTIEPKKSLEDTWDMHGKAYNLSLHGPNGFVRGFASSGDDEYSVKMVELPDAKSVRFVVQCTAKDGVCKDEVVVEDMAYGKGLTQFDQIQKTGETTDRSFDVSESGNWYDFNVRSGLFTRRFMGRIETGADTITDPALGVPKKESAGPFPKHFRDFVRTSFKSAGSTDDQCTLSSYQKFGFVKDKCFNADQ
eukprot:TRINITY_DN1393_c0_g2_i3.p1 TRINITY_DN1393_c0_g2~~TRINITY_DN1393_c0_g2_i3.p1  ORF type:complete len:731 (+),score=145.81 TRINITY_DN1393_c0_g2_i3:58-2193(+)